MKLLAQHGHAEGNKVNEGIDKQLIDGVIFSPKDISLERLPERIGGLAARLPGVEILFDPQIYAAMITNDPSANLGKLENYENYFTPLNRNRLEVESNVAKVLRETIAFECSLGLSGIIAPNILISRSFDSREATISKTFIRLTGEIYAATGDERPVFATLAVARDALTNPLELQEFLNDITVIENPPTGFYILVSGRTSETRLEIFNSDVFAGWMLMNHSLKVNGFLVLNGYSDLMTPFLGALGADAGATGWWSNLRMFSMDRFVPNMSGGRLPIQRYLSKALLNRITFYEYQAWKRFVPEIVNGLGMDGLYDDEPERAREVLQSWEAIRSLAEGLSEHDLATNLDSCLSAIENAKRFYERIQSVGLRPDSKSNQEHLEPLAEGIRAFRRLAEI